MKQLDPISVIFCCMISGAATAILVRFYDDKVRLPDKIAKAEAKYWAERYDRLRCYEEESKCATENTMLKLEIAGERAGVGMPVSEKFLQR